LYQRTSRAACRPLDQGIIAAFKAFYRPTSPATGTKSLKDLTPNFYQMMRWTPKAWMQVVTGSCIQNCWNQMMQRRRIIR
jgi:hypothetical protein